MTYSTNPFNGLIVPATETRTNARLKLYPGLIKMQVANRRIFKTGDWVPHDYEKKDNKSSSISNADDPNDNQHSKEVSRARAKTAVEDIALLNSFEYMFTWTLDPQKVDRHNPDEVYRYLKPALSNLTQRKDFQYLLIPEYHALKPGEDRPAIHFHGLCNLGNVRIERAMKRKRPRTDKQGRPVYNMVDWPYGWSTVVPLDGDYDKAVAYITKYVTKQPQKILGKYYLSSRNLIKKPEILPIIDGIPYEEFRDPDKLISGQQFEANIYGDIYIITEKIKEDNQNE